MNSIEIIKTEKDPLQIIHELESFAKEGWESISEEDVHRLKWYGLFLRKPTPGYFMLRVRIPNGFTNSQQIKMVAHIAKQYGNGTIDITTRQQVQIRGLKIESMPAVYDLLDMVGLNSMQTGMDNVRNIMGCPVSGLAPKELVNVFPILDKLNDYILKNPQYTNLPRKLNIALSGCPENCLHLETQDLAFIPAFKESEDKKIVGFNVRVGGKLGSGGYRIASCLDIFLKPEELIDVCLEIIAIYNEFGNREVRTQNRLSFLVEDWGEKYFRSVLIDRLGYSLETAGTDAREKEVNEHIGIFRQKQKSLNYVGLKVLVGRINFDELRELAFLAEKYGNGEIRISPAQTLIIPNVSDDFLGDLVKEPLLKKLLYAPSSIMKNLVSCVGIDYCGLATIETKERAVEVARKLEGTLENVEPLSMHWSGCSAGCGNHLVADIGLLGKRVKIGKEIVDAVDIFVGGRSGPYPKESIKIMENVPCSGLPHVLESIVPYHARKKIHPIVKKRKAKKHNKPEACIKPMAPLIEK